MKRSGGELLVACLENLGATQAFGVPGESYLAVLDAMHDTKGRFDFMICRQEGGAAYMAEAWAKLTGKPGICFVTRGPGATNASIGVHSAMQASTPMILFVGQIATDQREREAFQEVNYRAYFGDMTKWAVEIDHAERIPELVSRAWTTALSGRPGPVVVALPEDMLSAVTEKEPCKPVRVAEASASPEDIAELASMLEKAERPLVIAGGGGWTDQGKADLLAFAGANNLPVSVAFRYHDLFDHDSDCYCGDAGVGMTPQLQARIREADLVIGINIRFGEMTTGAWSLFDVPEPGQAIVHSHASDRELNKIYRADLPLHAGPNRMAAAMRELGKIGDWSAWRDQARTGFLQSRKAKPQPGGVDLAEIITWLDENLDDDAITTNGAGNFAIWPNRFLRYGGAGKRKLLAPQSGAMGYGIPAAVAAKKLFPGRQVVCFAGDGDFQMTCQELGSAMQAGCQPIILVFNNGTYGTIRMHQERNYPERVSGTEIVNPDFAALARAYGYHGEKVEKTSDFAEAFKRARASKTGAVIELLVDVQALSPAQTLSEMRAQGLNKQ